MSKLAKELLKVVEGSDGRGSVDDLGVEGGASELVGKAGAVDDTTELHVEVERNDRLVPASLALRRQPAAARRIARYLIIEDASAASWGRLDRKACILIVLRLDL
jgi:hypothetical protein